MNPIEPCGLRAHLLEVEPPNVERLRVLQEEVRTVFTEELSRGMRAWRVVSLVMAIVSAGFGWYVATHLNAPADVASPNILRAIWTIFTFTMLAEALRSCVVLWRGHVDLREAPTRRGVQLGTNVLIALLLILQAISHPTIPMMGWALFGLLWVIVAAVRNVTATIAASELTTREMLLRLELRLAESAERGRA